MISEVFNQDCMVGMARYPDKIKIEAFRSITGTEKGKFKAIIIIAETEELDIELMNRIESRPTIE